MGKLLDSLFHKAGRTYGKARWIFKSFSGDEDEAIQSEYALGRYLAREIENKSGVIEQDPALDIIQTTGDKLFRRLTNKKRTFRFTILQSDEINALALPGGFIFITDALLEMVRSNQDEIAFVLGHEMAHVVKGHALDRLVAHSLIGVISGIGPGRGVVGGLAQKTLAKLLYSSYSREQEMEADWFGIGIMKAAGFNPKGALSFMKRLKATARQDDDKGLVKYFSSHPEHDARMKNLKSFFE